jgi:hypothetical protein
MAKITGADLARQWGINVAQARYRKDGSWYHTLTQFPAALLDEAGYLRFETEADYDACDDLSRSTKPGKDWLSPKSGTIATIAGYKPLRPRLFLAPPESAPGVMSEVGMWEGGRTTVTVNRYERDPKAREACIKIYGLCCSVCGFDFLKVYGEIGRGYIQVHHIVPVSAVDARYKVNPRKHLRSVCSNCHDMLHTRKPEPLTVDELKGALCAERTAE